MKCKMEGAQCPNRNYSSVVVICRKKYNIVEDLRIESVICIRGKRKGLRRIWDRLYLCHGNIIPFGRKDRKIRGCGSLREDFYTRFKPKN